MLTSISAYTYNDGKGNICQHRLSLLAYMFSVDKGDVSIGYNHIDIHFNDGIGDLCAHSFLARIHVSKDYLCWHTCSTLA